MTSRTTHIAVIFFLVFVQILLVGSLLTRKPIPSTALRIAYIPTEMAVYSLSPYGPGFDRELVLAFCADQGRTPQWHPVKTIMKGLADLQNDQADILICQTTSPRISLPPDLRMGPVYRVDNPVIVHNKWKLGLLQPEDICDYSVAVPPNPVLHASLQTLATTMRCPAPKISSIGPGLKDLLATMTEDRTRFALISASGFKLWQPFFPDIRLSLHLHKNFGPAWIWRTPHNPMDEPLRRFWETMPASSFFQERTARYFGFLPEKSDFYELDHLASVIQKKLPRYSSTILKAARKYRFDPLLLVAMIYQESHFNPRATSKTGVRGLLQISRITAQELGINDRLLPEKSIMGGAKYLRSLMDRFQDQKLDPLNKLFLSLGAYNQGMGHIQDALLLAEEKGLDPGAWRNIKKIFPLLSYQKYYSKAKYGYCRGIEAVDYVDSIRYYYYYLTGLIRLARPEGKNLAFLASDVSFRLSQ